MILKKFTILIICILSVFDIVCIGIFTKYQIGTCEVDNINCWTLEGAFMGISFINIFLFILEFLQLCWIKPKDDSGGLAGAQAVVHVGLHLLFPILIFSGQLYMPWQATLYSIILNAFTLPFYYK